MDEKEDEPSEKIEKLSGGQRLEKERKQETRKQWGEKNPETIMKQGNECEESLKKATEWCQDESQEDAGLLLCESVGLSLCKWWEDSAAAKSFPLNTMLNHVEPLESIRNIRQQRSLWLCYSFKSPPQQPDENNCVTCSEDHFDYKATVENNNGV